MDLETWLLKKHNFLCLHELHFNLFTVKLQFNLFYKIQQGLVGISLPPEVCPLDRTSRLPNVSPYRHIQPNCDIYINIHSIQDRSWCGINYLYVIYLCQISNQQLCQPLNLWYDATNLIRILIRFYFYLRISFYELYFTDVNLALLV